MNAPHRLARPGRGWLSLNGLAGVRRGNPVRSSKDSPLISVHDVDGTHLGLAVNWWSAIVEKDAPLINVIKATVDPAEVLRSAIEVVLSQVSVLASRDGRPSAAVLRAFAVDPVLSKSHRSLCAELAATLEDCPTSTTMEVTRIVVADAMEFVAFLGRVVEYRAGTPVDKQIDRYIRFVTTSQGLS